eukprot:3648724-Pyramimonas_sp.AAC.2
MSSKVRASPFTSPLFAAHLRRQAKIVPQLCIIIVKHPKGSQRILLACAASCVTVYSLTWVWAPKPGVACLLTSWVWAPKPGAARLASTDLGVGA